MKQVDFIHVVDLVKKAFRAVAPFWPLRNLIAVNPLQGFEDLPIEQAMQFGAIYFEQADLPDSMRFVNLHTIKWLQVYCDNGQATIAMPSRKKGLYAAWKNLIVYDATLHKYDADKQNFLKNLSEDPKIAITQAMLRLNLSEDDFELFLTLMVTTLPGWASYIRYRTEWCSLDEDVYYLTQVDYLAMRAVIASLSFFQAAEILDWYHNLEKNDQLGQAKLKEIESLENDYRVPLLKKISKQFVHLSSPCLPEAQFVFCIDTRSEQFRKSIEAVGNYKTFGYAGFFGIPVRFVDEVTGASYTSCPVLLSCKHEVKKTYDSLDDYEKDLKSYKNLIMLKRVYQSLKYAFSTAFCLVECLGFINLFWMSLLSFTPGLACRLKSMVSGFLRKSVPATLSLDNINFTDQCFYAESLFNMIGLTDSFAPVVVLSGHASRTYNNAYASILDCGACGGSRGGNNASLLASILNQSDIRNYLCTKGIVIPKDTIFIGAEHDTTTDIVTFYKNEKNIDLQSLEKNLKEARVLNNSIRIAVLEKNITASQAVFNVLSRSQDWAQVRPEWGLARNSAFIVGPRDITIDIDLKGRCFLHSYDYKNDPDDKFLSAILTAPMVVAQWINSQYLFSALDNVAYGSGSKVTHNITGKIGIMQGNASDLMTGLPLQSLYISDTQRYHEPQRLMAVVYCPQEKINAVVTSQPVLQKLFGNGWVQLFCIEPDNKNIYSLQRDFTWKKID